MGTRGGCTTDVRIWDSTENLFWCLSFHPTHCYQLSRYPFDCVHQDIQFTIFAGWRERIPREAVVGNILDILSNTSSLCVVSTLVVNDTNTLSRPWKWGADNAPSTLGNASVSKVGKDWNRKAIWRREPPFALSSNGRIHECSSPAGISLILPNMISSNVRLRSSVECSNPRGPTRIKTQNFGIRERNRHVRDISFHLIVATPFHV